MQVQVVDYRAPDAAEKFTRSLHETGFGVLTNHPIRQALVEKIYADWLVLLQRRRPSTGLCVFQGNAGWVFLHRHLRNREGFSKQKDIKEYFHVYPWGRIPEQLKEDALTYYREANALAEELLGWVERYTPPEIAARYREPLSHMIQGSSKTLLRVLRYPPLTGEEPVGSIRAAAHGDINLLTILPAANEPGLQVLGKDDAMARRALRLRHADHQHRRHAAGSLRRLLPVDAAPRRQPDRRRGEEEPRVAAAVSASAR